MALDAQLRAAVAAAKLAVADLLVTITHEPYASTDADGKVSYDTSAEYQGFVTTGSKSLFRQTGIEAVPGPTILFMENVTISVRDRITLPDGSQPAIIDVDGVADPVGGTYYTQVKCGRPARGSVT